MRATVRFARIRARNRSRLPRHIILARRGLSSRSGPLAARCGPPIGGSKPGPRILASRNTYIPAIVDTHSPSRRMRIGSIVAARHAGISAAQQPTAASAISEDVRETGLHRLLSVQAAIGRWSIATSANPPPIPSAIVIIAAVNTSRRMRVFDAPNAMRTANSRVRSETAHATTLYMPTPARARANAAHAENRDAANR
jgi:hypothetical protein